VTVSSATLHNEDELRKKDIRAGDTVIVRRAGDVIPEVARSLGRPDGKRSRRYEFPLRCPVCSGPVAREQDTSAHMCMNPSCHARLRESLFHWGSRDALDIEGLGSRLAEQLVEKELVSDVSDLYNLSFEQLAALDRMGKKSARNFLDELDKSRNANLQRFITGLGIPGVGRTVSGFISEMYSNLEEVMNASEEELEDIGGIGPVLADNLHRFFSDRITRNVVDRLIDAGFRPASEKSHARGTPLKGLTVVFTGGIAIPRSRARALAERAGAKVTGSVSSKTDMLVAGPGAGSKLNKARELGIEIVSEAVFLKRIEGTE
jgi:DNA ligase (NAD+)